jgi:RND family efflux transporter MFP subunit
MSATKSPSKPSAFKPILLISARVGVTVLIVIAALYAAHWLWIHYEVEPRTRDGRVRADFVQIAPDVSGLVTSVAVHDNQQVHVGDSLFTIDRARYELALADAKEKVATQRAQLSEAEREHRRNVTLADLASSESREQSSSRLEVLRAGVNQANTAVDIAQLNLDRTLIKASVNGMVTDLNLRPGSYFAAGRPALTLIDSDSFYVVGYFEETKLPRIHIGDRARVQLMGEKRILEGRVESITSGIEDRERTPDANLLPNVNPTFNWVRLAQRIPVRIALDAKPDDLLLIMGRTASVEVLPSTAPLSSPKK